MKNSPRHLLVSTVMAITLLASRPTQARLGETPQECIARYGQPIERLADNQLLYSKSGFVIIATFHNGKVDAIAYRKAAENALGKGEEISDNEIELLLSSNSGRAAWKKRHVISMNREWETEDGSLFATYITFENILLVTTKEYLAREQAAKDAKEKKNLEGF